MSEGRILEKLIKSLEKDPKMISTIKSIYDYHTKIFKCNKCGSSDMERISSLQYQCKRCGSSYIYKPFTAEDLSPQPPFPHILELINTGIIEAVQGGGKRISYILAKPEVLESILRDRGLIGDLLTSPVEIPKLEVEEGPEDLKNLLNDFKSIVFIITKSIKSGNPAHFLLSGPRISLKELVIEELHRIPGSYLYIPGSDPSLDEIIWGVKPNPLLISSLERMRSSVDLSTLANFLSSEKVYVKRVGEIFHHKSTVIASSSSERGIPRDLMPYFIPFYLPPIEDESLRRKITAKIIMERIGKGENFSNYVAEKSLIFTEFGFREFLELAKLCDDVECVDSVVSILVKYSKPAAKPAAKRKKRGR